jgi:hypothetical protein
MRFLILLAVLFFSLFLFEERHIDFQDTYTKAICSGKTCRDFLVSCSNNELIYLKPISGFVTFGENWIDLREDRVLC